MTFYVLLTEAFAQTYENYTEGANTFSSAVTNTGQHVCSVNALNVFPSIFTGVAFQVIELQPSDFPTPQGGPGATFTFAERKQNKLHLLDRQTRQYIDERYDAVKRDALQMVFAQALATSNAAVAARVGQVMAWAGTVMSYNALKTADINACLDATALDAVTWDLPGTFDSTDPLVLTSEFV